MISIVTAALLLAATPAPATTPKNIILLVSDGSGLAQFTAASNVRGEKFRIGTMPIIGLHTTACADRAVTDSAAAATTFATGFKTNYESVSIDPKSGEPLETVVERAEKNGKATGLVTTAYFWDATPAAFAAHAKHRHDKGVREQMMQQGIEIIAGTGLQSFGKDGVPAFEEFAKTYGYTAISTRAALDAAEGDRLAVSFPTQERDADPKEARLPELATWAIEHLKNDPDGFFLLIEHEGTDSANHQNAGADFRNAIASFDEAVGVALDFASQRNDTLVLVTGDHETGGMRLSETKSAKWRIEYSTTDHTATAVPIFAYGAGAASFGGFQDNTDIGKKLIDFVSKK
ncbi:MAG TPA: alkaline phosphatase [Thermoanaerobaculia bacterium]|nr:alkaline phosphatase [Thermoanaerobaculia bacterium]